VIERPILSSGSMVNAIREGRQTMTRRVVKPNPYDGAFVLQEGSDGTLWPYRSVDGETAGTRNSDELEIPLPSPYGVPGDRLWVRETFSSTPDGHVHYRATDQALGPWRPSIFMARWASRITLEVTAIRVERLQEITEEDCIKEGIDYTIPHHGVCALGDIFEQLWDRINGKKYPWSSNPWVWVISFRRLP